MLMLTCKPVTSVSYTPSVVPLSKCLSLRKKVGFPSTRTVLSAPKLSLVEYSTAKEVTWSIANPPQKTEKHV